jgi:ATP-dependent RNA circularization protein (DNA/RNA ligase family)
MFFVFDIYDINAQKYLAPGERMAVFEELKAVAPLINHVPVLEMEAKLFDNLGIEDVEGLLKYAEGPSITNKVREGVVFKRLDGQFSFKAISNKFLIGEKD